MIEPTKVSPEIVVMAERVVQGAGKIVIPRRSLLRRIWRWWCLACGAVALSLVIALTFVHVTGDQIPMAVSKQCGPAQSPLS